MDKILRNTNIWDLHIHTPLGTPTKKNYGNASTEEFIDTGNPEDGRKRVPKQGMGIRDTGFISDL